jgi:hypothetical protein
MGSRPERVDALAALAALARRGVELQPAAEAVIQACRRGGEPPEWLMAEGERVVGGYRALRKELRALGEDDPAAGELGFLLDDHLRRVAAALAVATGARTATLRQAGRERTREELTGLGRSAGRLVALRDRLSRAGRVGGRPVQNVPSGDRF